MAGKHDPEELLTTEEPQPLDLQLVGTERLAAAALLARGISDTRLREKIVYTLLTLYAVAVVCTFALIFLLGFGTVDLPLELVHYLGVTTVAEVAGLLAIPIRNLFPGSQAGET